MGDSQIRHWHVGLFAAALPGLRLTAPSSQGNILKSSMSIVAVCSAIVLSGCAATVKPMTTPEGNRGFLISCDGSADDWASCYEAATKACGGGKYNVIDRNGSSTGTVNGPLVTRSLIAECK